MTAAPPWREFADPFAVAIGRDGRVYIADGGDSNRIRALEGERVITVAGDREGYADGPSGTARLHTPSGIAVADDGAIYIADTGNHRIRRVTPDGRVTTIAGSGVPGLRDGRGTEAQFNGPIGVAIAPWNTAAVSQPSWIDRLLQRPPPPRPGIPQAGGAERLLVADTYNDAIRLIDGVAPLRRSPAGAGRVLAMAPVRRRSSTRRAASLCFLTARLSSPIRETAPCDA